MLSPYLPVKVFGSMWNGMCVVQTPKEVVSGYVSFSTCSDDGDEQRQVTLSPLVSGHASFSTCSDDGDEQCVHHHHDMARPTNPRHADNIGERKRHAQLFYRDESAAYDSSVSVCRLSHLHAHSVGLTLKIMLYCSLRLLELPFFSQMIGQHTPQ